MLEHLRAGAAVALVSDAGMPAISDPGAMLASAAVEAGLPVIPVPGELAADKPCGLQGQSATCKGHLDECMGLLSCV